MKTLAMLILLWVTNDGQVYKQHNFQFPDVATCELYKEDFKVAAGATYAYCPEVNNG